MNKYCTYLWAALATGSPYLNIDLMVFDVNKEGETETIRKENVR
jgi:hypothetical protein